MYARDGAFRKAKEKALKRRKAMQLGVVHSHKRFPKITRGMRVNYGKEKMVTYR